MIRYAMYYISPHILPKRTILCILVFSLLFFTYKIHAQHKEAQDFVVNKVVIDPGHGGKDPGAQGKHANEKDIVLAIGLKLGKYIEENFDDVEVIYTRTTDEFVELHKRAEIANSNDADLFISLHADAFTNPQTTGTSTLVLGLHRAEENFEVAKRENKVILLEEDYSTHYEEFDPESPETYIALALMQSVYFDQSISFAKTVQDQFRDRVKRKDRGVKQQGLLVLAQTSMPGVLIETGFITNGTEEKFLISEKGQDYIASAIFRAFRDYKNEIESRSVFANGSHGRKPVASDKTLILDPGADKTDNPNASIDTTSSSPNTGDTILFKVQVTASSRSIPLDAEIFNDFNDVMELQAADIYKYAVGRKTTYPEIVEYSKWVRNRFPDAFVIALKNGEIIPIEQALKETQ